MTPAVNQPRLLDRLSQLALIGGGAGQGITRLAWSAEDRQAVGLVANWARQAGGAAHIDGAGNLVAEWVGSERDLPPLVTGSHLDTVIGAGALDGAYGVVAGIEALASLCDAGFGTRHPVRLVAFANEEGVVAPPFSGSRAIAGVFRPEELAAAGPDGMTLESRLRRAGCVPEQIGEAAWTTPLAAMVELHVEQGPVLDRAGAPIGVVTAITAQQRGSITVIGETNHAGSTAMALRRDALVAAARAVLAVEKLATEGPADVATVGRFDVWPGVANVIPGRSEMSFDVRAVDDTRAAEALDRLHRVLAGIEQETGCTLDITALPPTPGARTDEGLRRLIADSARAAGLQAVELVSRAGHDCAHLGGLGPVAMIFVPSAGGVSHSPAEATPPRALVAGAAVLLDTLVRADKVLDA